MTDNAAAPEGATSTPEPETLHGCPVTASRGQRVVHVPVPRYLEVLRLLLADGFDLCTDLTGVDYLTHPGRPLPDGVAPERFEVVLNLIAMAPPERLRVRVQVPVGAATLPSTFDLWPGNEAPERETFDMFGIVFEGHPDLSRILMPEDWDGHPLRKDYDVGAIPVQFRSVGER